MPRMDGVNMPLEMKRSCPDRRRGRPFEASFVAEEGRKVWVGSEIFGNGGRGR